MALKNCKECGAQVSTSASRCPKCGKKLKHTGLYIVLSLFVIALAILIGIILALQAQGKLNINSPWDNYKNKTITAENYENIMNEVEEKMKDNDELYYLTYSTLYYIMQDGLSEAFSSSEYDEEAMYKRIYGKTVQQLIDEGKQLMQDNGITLEEYKQQLNNTNNAINQFNTSVK